MQELMNGVFSGTINEIVRSDGSSYDHDNWRMEYQGLHFIAEPKSSEYFEGMVMLKFVDINDAEHYLRTGVGRLSWNKDLSKGVLVSKNSRYYFTRDSKGFLFNINPNRLEG